MRISDWSSDGCSSDLLTFTVNDVDLITSAVTRAVLETAPQVDTLGLTPRMRDVLIGIAAGEQMTDPARRLRLSRDTVRAHRRRLFHHPGANTDERRVGNKCASTLRPRWPPLP